MWGALSAPADTGPDPNRYSVAFTSYLATPSTQAAENFAPLPWRTRTVVDDPSNQARAAPGLRSSGSKVLA